MKTKKFGQRRNIRTRGWLACILLIMLMTTACQGLPVEFEVPWQNTGMPVKKTATERLRELEQLQTNGTILFGLFYSIALWFIMRYHIYTIKEKAKEKAK